MRKTHAHYARMYRSWKHVAIAFVFVLLPFFFFLVFSEVAHVAGQTLFADIFVSFARLLAAYAAAAVFAWVSAALFFRGKRAIVALPFFDVLQSFPAYAALPIAVHFWGSSNATVICFLFLAIVWPIFFSTVSALKLMRKEWEEAVEISGLKGAAYIRYFLFPASIPGLITGSLVGIGNGWEALVATEIIVAVKTGLGSFFSMFSAQSGVTMFALLGFLILIFSINKLVWLPLLEWSHGRMEE